MASQHGSAAQNPPTWTEPPWSGWIETTGDALLILEAARRGLIPRVTRRLVDSERKMITSGSVFVFDEDESGIKRWTDGFFWSPSRILGNFLLYRETDKRGAGQRPGKEGEVSELESANKPDGSLSRPKSDPGHPGVDKQRERNLVGSLTNSYKFKPDGLMKKTFSLSIGGVAQHLISYYKIEDVESGRLRSPSSLPELASLEISPEYLDKTHFRNPPKVELCVDGVLRYRGEADDIDASPSLLSGPPLTGLPLLTGGREVSDNAASKRIKRFEPYNQPTAPTPKRHRKTPTAKLPGPTDGSQPQPAPDQPDTLTPPIASPTSSQHAPPVFPDPNAPSTSSPPAPAAPTAAYPTFGVPPYYGYMQPPPHMYPPQPGYPLSPNQPPPPPSSAQYSYAGYPPAPVAAPAPAPASAPQSVPTPVTIPPTPTNTSVSPSDTSQGQSSSITTSPSPPQPQPPANPQPMQPQPQPGYYHPHAPHPYYPPPQHASPSAPQMYPGYPPAPAPPTHSTPPSGVWGPHPHPYGAYAPPPPHPQQPQSQPQAYSYPGAPYPAAPPPPQQQQHSPQPQAVLNAQYQQQPAYQAQQAHYGQTYAAYAATAQKPGQPSASGGQVSDCASTSEGLKKKGARNGDGDKSSD